MGNCNNDKHDKNTCADDKEKKAATHSDASSTASDAKGADEEHMDRGAANVSSGLEKKDLVGK